MSPILSVIVPIYNCEKYIENCLASILASKRPDIEVIAVDDGSIDNSLEICRKIAESDSRLTIVNRENGGECAARNSALDRVNGDWVMFVDGDDELFKGALDHIAGIAETSNADMLLWGYHTDGKDYSPDIHSPSTVCQTAMRRDEIYRHGLRFTEGIKVGGDVEFLLKYMGIANNIEIIDRILYNYIKRQGSAMTSSPDFLSRADEMTAITHRIILFWKIWRVKPNDLLNHLIYKRLIASLVYLYLAHPDAESRREYRSRVRLIVLTAKEAGIKSLNHPYIRLACNSMQAAMGVMRLKLSRNSIKNKG